MSEQKPREYTANEIADLFRTTNPMPLTFIPLTDHRELYDALAERLAECEAALGVYKAEEFRDAHFGQALSVLMAEEIFDYGKTAREYFEKWGKK